MPDVGLVPLASKQLAYLLVFVLNHATALSRVHSGGLVFHMLFRNRSIHTYTFFRSPHICDEAACAAGRPELVRMNRPTSNVSYVVTEASRFNLPDPLAGHLRFVVVDLLRLDGDTGRALADEVDSLAKQVEEVGRSCTAARVVAHTVAYHPGLEQHHRVNMEDR